MVGSAEEEDVLLLGCTTMASVRQTGMVGMVPLARGCSEWDFLRGRVEKQRRIETRP